MVGNPVREDVLALEAPSVRLNKRTGPVRVLIIGGSQGARILNHTLPIVAGLSVNMLQWHHRKGGERYKHQNELAKIQLN